MVRRMLLGSMILASTFLSQAVAGASDADLAADAVKAAGRTRGLCVDVGCGSAGLALAVARRSAFYVHCLETDDARVAAARKMLDGSGLYGTRVSVERGSLNRLPYPDYCANLVIRGDHFTDGLRGLSFTEVLRVLQPGGVAYLGQSDAVKAEQRLTAAQLRTWLTAAGITDFEIIERNGVWAKIVRPRPKGMGDWSHAPLGTPGRNPCVDDRLVRAPFQTLWINDPKTFTKFGLVTASAGRYIMRHGGLTHTGRWKPAKEPDLLQAYDGYNGVLLWERRLPALGGNGLVAVGDAVYAEAGGTLCALDVGTGAPRWQVRAADIAKRMVEWSTYACADGVVVGAVRDVMRAKYKGPPAKVLVGLDPADGRITWRVERDAGMTHVVVGDGAVFYATPPQGVRAVEIGTGRQRWTVDHEVRGAPRYHRGRLYFQNAVFATKDGALVGRAGPRRGILVGDRVVTGGLGKVGGVGGVYATDLRSGQTRALFTIPRDPYSPKTGIPDGGIYGRCIMHTASTHCYFFHYSGTVIGDLTNRTLFPTEAFRTNCRTGVIAGNGLVYNSASGCACTLVVRGNAALVPVDPARYEAKVDALPQLERGPAYGSLLADTSITAAWPAYRGDAARSNVSPARIGLPLKQAWSARVRGKITPPAVAGGLAVVGSDDHSVVALDTASGARRWRFVTGGEVRVTPTCWRGRVYAGSQDGYLYCLRAADGALIWRFRGGPDDRKAIIRGRPESLWPVAGGVIAQGGAVYFYAGRCSHDRVFIYKLDAVSGETIWCNDRAGRAVGVTGPKGGIAPHGISPSGVVAASDDLLYVPQGPTFPAGIRKRDGRIMWWNKRGDSTERSNINIQHLGGANLSVGGGLLFAGGPNRLSGHDQKFIAVDARTGRIWGQDDPRLFEKVMRDKAGRTIMPQNYKWGTYAITFGSRIAPVVVDGGIFTFGSRTAFRDLKGLLETQFAKSAADLDKWPRGAPTGTLVVAGDTVLAADGATLRAVSRRDGRPLWSGRVAAAGDILPNGLAATDGALIASTSSGQVVCLRSQ